MPSLNLKVKEKQSSSHGNGKKLIKRIVFLLALCVGAAFKKIYSLCCCDNLFEDFFLLFLCYMYNVGIYIICHHRSLEIIIITIFKLIRKWQMGNIKGR